MRHNVKKKRISRGGGARKLMIGNLATSIITHGKIQTTKARAKAVQPVIEKLIITAKTKEAQTAIRSINRILQTEESSKKLMLEIAPKYQDRISGFTRIAEIGFRAGDAAPLVQIELV